MVVIPLAPHMFDNCREAAFGAVKDWILSVLLKDLKEAKDVKDVRPAAVQTPGDDGTPKSQSVEDVAKVRTLGKQVGGRTNPL
jgi:hypothetical protein